MSHYFHTPTTPEHRRRITARFWDTDWEFVTADGVFSYDSLDQGTAVLLREVVPPVGATKAEWYESRGRSPFFEVSLPEAQRTLTQYMGRLIRTERALTGDTGLPRRCYPVEPT